MTALAMHERFAAAILFFHLNASQQLSFSTSIKPLDECHHLSLQMSNR